VDHLSFRQLVVSRFSSEEQRTCSSGILSSHEDQAQWNRAACLLTQAAVPWGRQTRLVSTNNGERSGSIYLCGEGEHDIFAAHIHEYYRAIYLYTTETPQPHQEGPLCSPRHCS